MSITGRPITVSISLLLAYQVQGQSKAWERANYDLKLMVVPFLKLEFTLTIPTKTKEKSNVWSGSENSKSMHMPGQIAMILLYLQVRDVAELSIILE